MVALERRICFDIDGASQGDSVVLRGTDGAFCWGLDLKDPDGALARIKAPLRAYNNTPADDWFARATQHTGPRVRPRTVP